MTPPFLETHPAPWAARGLASILLSLFAVGTTAAFVVRVPESVTAPFVLTPVRGGDPVRAFRSGMVREVRVAEAQIVARGERMYSIASAAIGDRAAEWQGLSSQIRGLEDRLAARREREASQQQADREEVAGLEDRIQALGRATELTTARLDTAREIAQRQKLSFEKGLSSWVDVSTAQVAADGLAVDLQRVESERVAAGHALRLLREQSAVRRAEARETEQGLLDELNRARIRKASLDRDLVHDGNLLVVTAPCDGSVLALAVRNVGAVVQEGETLAEVSCGGERLQAELRLPQERAGLVKAGQRVRLLYAAYPYQRYGALRATLRWISPAGEPAGLRGLADLESEAIVVNGERRTLRQGMTGDARIIVGRRALVSYAVEPLRQLRERFAAQ